MPLSSKSKRKKETAANIMRSAQGTLDQFPTETKGERSNEVPRFGGDYLSSNGNDSAITGNSALDLFGDFPESNFTFQSVGHTVSTSGNSENVDTKAADAARGPFDIKEVRRDAGAQRSNWSAGSSSHHTARVHQGAVRQQQRVENDAGSEGALGAPVVQVGEIHQEIPVHRYVDKNTVHVRHECRVNEEHQKSVEILKEKVVEKTIEHVRPIIDERVVHMPKYVDVPIVEKVQKVVDVPKRIERDVIIEEPTVQTVDEYEYYPVIKTEQKFVDLPQVVKSYTVVDNPVVEEEEEIIEVPQHEVVEHIDEIPIVHKVQKYVEVPRVVKIQKVVDVPYYDEMEQIVKVPKFVKAEPVVHAQEHVVQVPRVEVVDKTVEMPETHKFTKFMHYKEKRVELPKEEHTTVVDCERIDAVHLGTEHIIKREYLHEKERGEELSPIRREHHVWGGPLNPNVNNPPLPPSYDAPDAPPAAISNVVNAAPPQREVHIMARPPPVAQHQQVYGTPRVLPEHVPVVETQQLREVSLGAQLPVQGHFRYMSPQSGGGALVPASTTVTATRGGMPYSRMGAVPSHGMPPGPLVTPQGAVLTPRAQVPSQQFLAAPGQSAAVGAPVSVPQFATHAPAAPAQLIGPVAPSAREAPPAPPPALAAPGSMPVTVVNHSFYGQMVDNTGLSVPVVVDNVPTVVRPVDSETPYVEAACWPSLQHLKQQLLRQQQQQLIELEHAQQGALDAQQVACISAHFQRQEQELEQYVSARQGREEPKTQQIPSLASQQQTQQQQTPSSVSQQQQAQQQQEFFDHMRFQHQQLQLQQNCQALLQIPMMQAAATQMQLQYLQESQKQHERMSQERELQELQRKHEAERHKMQKESKTKKSEDTIIEADAEEQSLAKRVEQLKRKHVRQIAELKDRHRKKNRQQEEERGQVRSELSESQLRTQNEPPSVTSAYNSGFTLTNHPTYNAGYYGSCAPQKSIYDSGYQSLAPSNFASMPYQDPSIILPPRQRPRAGRKHKQTERGQKKNRTKSITSSENDLADSHLLHAYCFEDRERSTSRSSSLKAMREMAERRDRHAPWANRQDHQSQGQYRRAVEQWSQSINRPHTSARSFLTGLPAFHQEQQQAPSYGSDLFAAVPSFSGSNDMFSRVQHQQAQARNARSKPQFANFQSNGNQVTPTIPRQQNNPWMRFEEQNLVGSLNSWNTAANNMSAVNTWGGFGTHWK